MKKIVLSSMLLASALLFTGCTSEETNESLSKALHASGKTRTAEIKMSSECNTIYANTLLDTEDYKELTSLLVAIRNAKLTDGYYLFDRVEKAEILKHENKQDNGVIISEKTVSSYLMSARDRLDFMKGLKKHYQ